jgi:RNA polymerase primary sigma factor
MKRVRRALEAEGLAVDARSLAAHLLVDVEEAQVLLDVETETTVVSLDAPLSSDSGATTLGDFIADRSISSVEDVALQEVLVEVVHTILDELGPRSREIIELRFGLYGPNPRTLEEIGRVFGLTRERIRQIEAQSLDVLRAATVDLKLEDLVS